MPLKPETSGTEVAEPEEASYQDPGAASVESSTEAEEVQVPEEVKPKEGSSEVVTPKTEEVS